MAELKGLSLGQLFQKLGAIIKSFASDIENVVEASERQIPTDELKKLIADIKARSGTEPKDKKENEEILNALNQLLTDKRIFSIIAIETKDWLDFVDAIEKRVELNKDILDKEELQTVDKIKELTVEIRNVIRKEEKENKDDKFY